VPIDPIRAPTQSDLDGPVQQPSPREAYCQEVPDSGRLEGATDNSVLPSTYRTRHPLGTVTTTPPHSGADTPDRAGVVALSAVAPGDLAR